MSALEQELAGYSQRRDNLVEGIRSFADWLDRNYGLDAERSLRLADLAHALDKDRLTVAFVAEYSRGKTELINALFFSDLGRRLLPSGAGRTTMCPTEIHYDGTREPSLMLLPIETRLRRDPLARLKQEPIEWSTIRLDPGDPQQMQSALRTLAETRKVTRVEATALGLLGPGVAAALIEDEQGLMEIPAWRFAMLNYPHPLLKAGLCILDTPGLNALGAEPELTLSSIPNAHAVFFLLASDTGVTRSDLEIWQNHVHRHVNFHIAVLNKIDTLWDELLGELAYRSTVQKQLDETARVLKLPAGQVFAVSAQKALTARIKSDHEMLGHSGIGPLEELLREKIIPSRREILFQGAVSQLAQQVENERSLLLDKVRNNMQAMRELSSLSGKNREKASQMRSELVKEKVRYDASCERFKDTRKALQHSGDKLLDQLSEDALHLMLTEARAVMDDSWTTRGLVQAMHALSENAILRFARAEEQAAHMQQFLLQACERFQREHGLPAMSVPRLDLAAYRMRMQKLLQETEAFCADPANLLIEKRFMIGRFYNEVAAETRKTFEQSGREAKRWLGIALDPVIRRIREHKQALNERLEHIRQVSENVGGLQQQMARLKMEFDRQRQQKAELDGIAGRFGALAG